MVGLGTGTGILTGAGTGTGIRGGGAGIGAGTGVGKLHPLNAPVQAVKFRIDLVGPQVAEIAGGTVLPSHQLNKYSSVMRLEKRI